MASREATRSTTNMATTIETVMIEAITVRVKNNLSLKTYNLSMPRYYGKIC